MATYIANQQGMGVAALNPAAATPEIYKATLTVWMKTVPDWIGNAYNANPEQFSTSLQNAVQYFADEYSKKADFIAKVNSGEFPDIYEEIVRMRQSGGTPTTTTTPSGQQTKPTVDTTTSSKSLIDKWNALSGPWKAGIIIGVILVTLGLLWAFGVFDKKKGVRGMGEPERKKRRPSYKTKFNKVTKEIESLKTQMVKKDAKLREAGKELKRVKKMKRKTKSTSKPKAAVAA